MLLSEDKTSHLSHLILDGLKTIPGIKFLENDGKALREIKSVIADELQLEEDIDWAIRKKLSSYSRPIYEGSPEWEVLYKKFLQEEKIKHRRE